MFIEIIYRIEKEIVIIICNYVKFICVYKRERLIIFYVTYSQTYIEIKLISFMLIDNVSCKHYLL